MAQKRPCWRQERGARQNLTLPRQSHCGHKAKDVSGRRWHPQAWDLRMGVDAPSVRPVHSQVHAGCRCTHGGWGVPPMCTARAGGVLSAPG